MLDPLAYLYTYMYASIFVNYRQLRPDLFNLQAIYELYQGESDLVEDLTIVKKVRFYSIYFLWVFKEEEWLISVDTQKEDLILAVYSFSC